MPDPVHILVVDDQPDNGVLLKKMLRAEGYTVTLVESGQEALDLVRQHSIDLILLDIMMPGIDGLEVTRRLKADPIHRYVPILLVTARADLPSVVSGLDAGADDYLTKPVDRREVLARVRAALRGYQLQLELRQARAELEEKNRALEASYQELVRRTDEKAQLQAEVGDLRRQVAAGSRLRDMVGRSPGMRRVFEQVRLVAPSDATVLVRGETGTGKELVARAIHLESARSAGPFIALNCGAVPEGLLESELFGHEKGAFTGAMARKAGRFERAAGGTLFLDEIGDVPRSMQVRLLRVLQEREFERVGGTTPIAANVRIIAATHKDLEALVASGELRQDLYYRLNVVPIQLPPLRDRREDIPFLSRHLLEKVARTHSLPVPEFTPELLARLAAHDWPGNVRELENTLERALILNGGRPVLELQLPNTSGADPERSGNGASNHEPRPDLPRSVSLEPGLGVPDQTLPFKEWKHRLLATYERTYIVAALRRHRGNMAAAARETGVDAKTFSRKITEYEIGRREYLDRQAGES